MLSAPPGSSSLVPEVESEAGEPGSSRFLHIRQELSQHLDPGGTVAAPTIKKSASDGQVMPLDQTATRKSSIAEDEASHSDLRRNSDGAISIIENSNDDDPCSPIVLGVTDWSESAQSNAHILVPTTGAVQACYLGGDCLHSGTKYKCVACRVIVHQGCVCLLNSILPCKETFRDCVRKYREQVNVEHHWVKRKQVKGKCYFCGKHFQFKLGSKFTSNPGASSGGMVCSWCKTAYHESGACRTALEASPICDLGIHAGAIIPPSWIIKLPRKGSFKSSLKNNSPKRGNAGGSGLMSSEGMSGSRASRLAQLASVSVDAVTDGSYASYSTKVPSIGGASSSAAKHEHPAFILKPIPVANCFPVIVFLNPKSGGNQGAKLMQKFQWLLNPRQVFDLSQGGPLPAIEMFRRVPGVRLLACGGDGTVGWVLSMLDQLDNTMDNSKNASTVASSSASWPPVGVLPLGTGNDLSRTLGWGGGYTDEPIGKILMSLQSADVINMDRWKLEYRPLSEFPPSEKGSDHLPGYVVNNYFSLGVDAQIALQFHEAREANPQKFNSRIRNKIFYTQAGSKDLILRKWKTLTEYITIECDGKDITSKLREQRVHSVMFLNIQSYSSGTKPWNRQFGEQRLDDGLLEVIGVTTYQLPLLHAGGHGHCITQCKTAKITTVKTIPMQVDGEATRVNPGVIEISFLNQAKMLAKRKGGNKENSDGRQPASILKIGVSKISMIDYEVYYCQKDQLKGLAIPSGEIKVDSSADLEQVRHLVSKLQENNIGLGQERPAKDWCFLDSVTAERFFRIDRAQENLHFLIDICEASLYILETEESEFPQELQGGLGITPLCDDLVTPPRSPLTPSPGAAGGAAAASGACASGAASASSASSGATSGVAATATAAGATGGATGTCFPLPPPGELSAAGSHGHGKQEEQGNTTSTAGAAAVATSSSSARGACGGNGIMSGHYSPPTGGISRLPTTAEEEEDEDCIPPPPPPRPMIKAAGAASDPRPTSGLPPLRDEGLKTTDGILKAARLGDLKMLTELSNEGYSLLSTDETGKTGLHYGARFGHKEIIRFLLNRAPRSLIDMVDHEKGHTALHKAAAYKRRTICCMLVTSGANLNIQDLSGNTPQQLAASADDRELSNYLESQEHFQHPDDDFETSV